LKPRSITRRLIVSILLLEFAAALCVTGAALVYERHERFRAFDIMLRGRADSLLGAVQDAEDKQDNLMLDGTEANLPPDDVYLVEDEGGRVLGHSANWADIQEMHTTRHSPDQLRLTVHHRPYHAIRISGVRMVDPGDQRGGIPRHVTILYGAPTAPVWEAIRQAVAFYAIASLALLTLTGFLMTWLLKRGLAPLHDLVAAASTVSARSWQFAAPESARATRELAPLAHTIETVLDGLRLSFQQQEHFLSDAAHELKTATAVVKSSLQLLSLKPRSVAEYQIGLQRCEADCERMEEIVGRMLTLARLESGHRPPPASQATDLCAIVHGVARHLSSIAAVRQVGIDFSADATLPVYVDAEQLRTLCSNLLLNALEHSHPASVIQVHARRTADLAELRIEDGGDGIDPAVLPHVFNRFFRGDPSRSRNTGGTGLGLAIAKAIVQHAEGEIALASTLGAGTVVTVRLPLAATALLASSPATLANLSVP